MCALLRRFYWYNNANNLIIVRPDGLLDESSLHGACPVLKVSEEFISLIFLSLVTYCDDFTLFMVPAGDEMGRKFVGMERLQILSMQRGPAKSCR